MCYQLDLTCTINLEIDFFSVQQIYLVNRFIYEFSKVPVIAIDIGILLQKLKNWSQETL